MLEHFYVQFGFVSVDNSGSKVFQEIYKIAGLGFRIHPGTEWETNIRFYGYINIEKLFEVYERYQINKWVFISPHFWLLRNSAGSANNYSVLALRSHINF